MSNLNKKPVKRVSDFLKHIRHSEIIIELAQTAKTAEEAAKALQVPVGSIAKSLLFVFYDGTREIPVITLIAGDKKCKTEMISKVLNLDGNIRRPNAEEVKKITGYSIGGVSPVGLIKKMKVIIDASLKRFDIIWVAAGHPSCVFSASFFELKKMTAALESDKLTE